MEDQPAHRIAAARRARRMTSSRRTRVAGGRVGGSGQDDDLTVRSQYLWARGGNFLTRNVTVKRAAK